MRYAFHSLLRAGHEEAYERDHRVIPDDLAATFARIGVRSWSIWRSGVDLFHFVEIDDYDAAMAALADDEANAAWQAFIGKHVDHFALIDGDQRLPLVWDLKAQLGEV